LSKISFDQFVDLRLLLSIEGIGPTKIRNLLAKLKSFNNILSANYSELVKVDGISKNLAERILQSLSKRIEISNKVEIELNRLKKLNANLLTIWDDEYPEQLKSIYDPPIILYYKGNLDENDKYSISIVGTRQPTNYGKIQAEKFAQELVEQNITIISGLARGIDSIAHKSALKNNGRTIAVIGSGLDVIYPPENKNLFNEISESGIIFSEFELGTKPDAQNFPRRNRIISGLSLGTLVVETGISGGAIQTANFALDQNREVFAIPGNLGVKQSEGTNSLIQKGEAKLVTSSNDILLELELKLKPIIGKNIPKPQIELNMFEEKIMQSLSNEPKQIDIIASESSLSTADCLVYLLSLEFKGLVKQLPGKRFCLM